MLIVFGVAAVAFMLAGVGKGRSDAGAPLEPTDESCWRRALSQGTPVVQTPCGTFEARPRVITALVPPASASFSVTIFDQAGRVVFQREEKPGDRGCFVEEGEIGAAGSSFRAGKLVVTFPDDGAVTLEPGRSYGVAIAIAGGHASASSVFQIMPVEGALHGAAPESR
jgi:hypothetical protein